MSDRSFFIKDIENEIYLSLIKMKRAIYIPQRMGFRNIDSTMQNVLDKHPDIFYVTEWKSRIFNGYVFIEPAYAYAKKEYNRIKQECDKQVNIILSRVESMTIDDSIKRLHDILIRNIRYDGSSESTCHSIEGALLYRRAVCDGYSRLYKYLLDILQVPCIVVRGRGCNPSGFDSEMHMWNMVNLRGDWYHIDVTYDATITVSNYIRYDYYLIDDDYICKDHFYNKQVTPRADIAHMNPYQQEPVLRNKSEIIRFVNTKTGNGIYEFIIRLHRDLPLNDAETLINSSVSEVCSKHNSFSTAQFNINPSTKIVYVRLK